MTSVLNVDTIADKAGTGPVGLTKQSAAKAFVLFDMVGSAISANGTGQSLNVSSMTDVATGRGKPTFTNNMSDAQYAPVCSAHYSLSLIHI